MVKGNVCSRVMQSNGRRSLKFWVFCVNLENNLKKGLLLSHLKKMTSFFYGLMIHRRFWGAPKTVRYVWKRTTSDYVLNWIYQIQHLEMMLMKLSKGVMWTE